MARAIGGAVRACSTAQSAWRRTAAPTSGEFGGWSGMSDALSMEYFCWTIARAVSHRSSRTAVLQRTGRSTSVPVARAISVLVGRSRYVSRHCNSSGAQTPCSSQVKADGRGWIYLGKSGLNTLTEPPTATCMHEMKTCRLGRVRRCLSTSKELANDFRGCVWPGESWTASVQEGEFTAYGLNAR